MSNLRLQGTTSGAITLSAPAVAGDSQITFPAETGEAVVKDSGGNVEVNSINNGPLAGFRNAIINGNFDVWARGSSFSGTGAYYTADRWFVSGQTKSITANGFTFGQTVVPNSPVFSLRFNITDTSSAYPYLEQRIEDVRTFSNQQVTLSFWARCVSGSSYVQPLLWQFFGSGGSADVNLNGEQRTLTSDWQKYVYTFNLPSVQGKTAASIGHFLGCRLAFSPNTVADIYIAQVQLEAGPVATPFERRPLPTELALCQRYYTVLQVPGNSYVGQYTSANGGMFYGMSLSLPVEMFYNPTKTYVYSAGTAYWVAVGALAYSGISNSNFTFSGTTNSVCMRQARLSYNSTPTVGAFYIFEAAFNIHCSAEL